MRSSDNEGEEDGEDEEREISSDLKSKNPCFLDHCFSELPEVDMKTMKMAVMSLYIQVKGQANLRYMNAASIVSVPRNARFERFCRETGWGVRSQDLIPACAFICEFAGVVLTRASPAFYDERR